MGERENIPTKSVEGMGKTPHQSIEATSKSQVIRGVVCGSPMKNKTQVRFEEKRV